MTGFIDADDRQAAKHGYRQMAEHLALFQEACDELRIHRETTSELVQMFFGYLLGSMQQSSMQRSVEQLGEIMRDMLNPDEDSGDSE